MISKEDEETGTVQVISPAAKQQRYLIDLFQFLLSSSALMAVP